MTQTLARTAARHPWRVVIAWIAAIVVAVVLVAGFLGDGLTSDGYVTNDPESLQAYDLMGQRYGRPDGPDDFVVLRSDSATADDAPFQARLDSLTGDLGAAVGAANVGEDAVSRDRHAILVPLNVDRRRPDRAGRRGRGGGERRRLHRDGDRRDDARPRLRRDLGARPPGGRAEVRPPGRAGHPRPRLRRARLGVPAAPARARLDRRRARPHRARRPGMDPVPVRDEHAHRHGPGPRDRLRAVRRLTLPRGARPRPREGGRDRGDRCDGQPRRALQRQRLRARDGRPPARPEQHHAEPRGRRDPGRNRLGGRGADAAAGDPQPPRRPRQRAARAGPRPQRDEPGARREPRLGLDRAPGDGPAGALPRGRRGPPPAPVAPRAAHAYRGRRDLDPSRLGRVEAGLHGAAGVVPAGDGRSRAHRRRRRSDRPAGVAGDRRASGRARGRPGLRPGDRDGRERPARSR